MTLVVLFSFIFFLYDQPLHFTRSTTGKSAITNINGKAVAPIGKIGLPLNSLFL